MITLYSVQTSAYKQTIKPNSLSVCVIVGFMYLCMTKHIVMTKTKSRFIRTVQKIYKKHNQQSQ